MKTTLITIAAVIATTSLISGCAAKDNTQILNNYPPAYTGLAPNSQSHYALNYYSSTQATIAELRQHNVQVIQAGDTLKIILPSDAFFKPQTNQLNPIYTPSMDLISHLLKSYGDAQITVAGNTDNIGTAQDKFNRSYQQARTIAAYLWGAGIPLRNMKILGRSDDLPVASNRTPSGSAANRRIEITIGQ